MRCGGGASAKQDKAGLKERFRCCAVVGVLWVQGCGLISKQGLGAGFLCWADAKRIRFRAGAIQTNKDKAGLGKA